MEEIKEELKEDMQPDTAQGAESNQYKPLENEQEYIQGIPQSDSTKQNMDGQSDFTKRIKRGAAILMITAFASLALYIVTSSGGSVDKSKQATEALKTHVSTALGAGTVLLSKDENYVGGDMTITHSSNAETTKIWLWDYAAEDGDYVQVLVDGKALGDPFMIRNKPVSFTVPSVGKIQVNGTRDGGGGITYGVYYELNHTTYFNGMDVGGDNLYTLVKQ